MVLGVAVIFGLNGLLPSFLQAFDRNLLSTSGNIGVTISRHEQHLGKLREKLAALAAVAEG